MEKMSNLGLDSQDNLDKQRAQDNAGTPSSEHKIKNKCELSSKLAESIESIDFDVLGQIYKEKLQMLGVEKNSVNLVEKENFVKISRAHSLVLHAGVYVGPYENSESKIGIGEGAAQFLEVISMEKQTFDDIILSVVCHEETHAVSGQECPDWESTSSVTKKREKHLGFSRDRSIKLFDKFVLHTGASYIMFNEGVTDMIGEDMYNKYISRKNNELEKEKDDSSSAYAKTYPMARILVNAVLDKISNECGLDKDVVWSVVQRGYFAGEDIGGDMMKRLFKDVVSEPLSQNIKKADSGFSLKIPFAVARIKTRKWQDDDRKRVRRWFKHVAGTFAEDKEILSTK